jgi:hypothetical protein
VHLRGCCALFDKDSVQPAHSIAARRLKDIGEEPVQYSPDSTHDHRPAEPRGYTKMLPVAFADGFGMVEENAAEHVNGLLDLANAAGFTFARSGVGGALACRRGMRAVDTFERLRLVERSFPLSDNGSGDCVANDIGARPTHI